MIIVIEGPQGSGKGTQAKLIEKEFGHKHFSMGDALRAEINKGTEEGLLIKKIIDGGNLVPEEITNKFVSTAIDENSDIILDGYPRNLDQAKYLIENFKVDLIIGVDIGEEESVKRLGKRRICSTTNKIFISDKITEKDIEECRNAGGEIITRDDDKPEAILNRLKIYHEKTEPLIAFFQEKGVRLIKVNGEQSIENVFNDIKKELS